MGRSYFSLSVERVSLNTMRIYGSCEMDDGDLFEVDEGDDVQRIYKVEEDNAVLIGSVFEKQTWHEVYRSLLEKTQKVQQATANENANLTDSFERYRSEVRFISDENARLNDTNMRLKLMKMDPRDKLHNLKADHKSAIDRLDKQAEATPDTEMKIEIERKIAEHEQGIDEITEILSYLKKHEPL